MHSCIKRAALPYANRHDLSPDITALTLSCSLPGSFRSVLALEGRREPVIRLQRHPLIYPIFSPSFLSPRERGRVRAISAPFARGNLHLVIPMLSVSKHGIQPLILRIQLLRRSLDYIGTDCTRFIKWSQVEAKARPDRLTCQV
jgi:hypothetical protein